MIRKVSSVLSYIVSGFFIYMVTLIAFIKVPENGKLMMSGIFIIPIILFHFVGLSISRFKNWMKSTGIVLLSGAGMTTFVVFTIVMVSMSDEFSKSADVNPFEYFNQWFTGGFTLLITISIGLILLLRGLKYQPKKIENQNNNSY